MHPLMRCGLLEHLRDQRDAAMAAAELCAQAARQSHGLDRLMCELDFDAFVEVARTFNWQRLRLLKLITNRGEAIR
jgi:hypothetical protein